MSKASRAVPAAVLANTARRAFLGQVGAVAAVAGVGIAWPASAFAAPVDASALSASAVDAFLDACAASTHELHSLVVARHGRIAAQGWFAPYRTDAPQSLYSLSKSFTSTAIGFAVTEGVLKLSDKVVDFFPEQAPAQIGEHLAQLRIEHLLTMSVGQASDAAPIVTREQDWVKTFLALPIEFAPGSVFLYNSAATYMLSAILQKVTGRKLVDYLQPRFFAPLGMTAVRWAECPHGINTGGWGLSATTESIFKLGQFYLQRGVWNGKPLLPSAWIEEATTFKIQQPAAKDQDLGALRKASDWHQGYGYQFWRCRHDAFRGDGAFGQFCLVLPKLDAVIAITSRTLDMQGLLNLVWDHLLPGLENPTAVDARASQRLPTRLAALALKTPDGAATSPKHAGARHYTIAPNTLGVQALAVSFAADTARIDFTVGDRTHAITSGLGRWRDGETALPGTPPEFTELVGTYVSAKGPNPVAVAGAWKDADTFEMQWRYYETPHFDTVALHFDGDRVAVRFLNSLTQMAAAVHPETRPVLEGTARS